MPIRPYSENNEAKTPPNYWFLNILFAIAIYLAAESGRLLGIHGPALQISVWWPATGISLAAVLLFGYNTWPSIFLGNFAYNFLHLFLAGATVINPFFAALLISLGSLFQALLAGFIIRTLSSPGYFSTVKDVFIFLVPGGILSCMTASSIGVFALHYFTGLSDQTLFSTWVTFWLGDTFGVYIFTPLLVVWLTYKMVLPPPQYVWEGIVMFLSYILLCVFSFYYNYPISHLFFPLTLWVTYRFKMFGATLAIFFISVTTIILTSLGYGIFAAIVPNPLVTLVSFLEVIIATALIVGALINEKEEAWDVLQNYTLHLEKKLNSQKEVGDRSQESGVRSQESGDKD